MNKEKYRLKLISVILISIISILNVSSSFDAINNKIVYSGNNWIYIVILVFYFYILKNKLYNGCKRLNIISITMSFVISNIYIISYVTSKYWLNGIMPTSRMYGLFISIKLIACFVLFFIIIKSLYTLFEKEATKNQGKIKEPAIFTKNIKSLLIVTIILFITYIPYLIDSYPGNLTYDFAIQVKQALGYEPLINHHPYITTMLIGVFLKLGNAISNYTAGIYIYTLIQYLMNCFTFSFLIYYMAKKNVDINFRIISLIFFILLPIFGFYSVWLTKDIIFTVFITFTTIGFIELSHNKNIINSKKYIFLMMICILISMVFRKNGFYVFLILLPITLIQNRKNWLKILIMFCVPILIFKILDGPVRTKLGITDGSKAEMLSIPAQQMARIYTYDKESLSDEQAGKIEKYINDENIKGLYDPLLSDPVKAKLNNEEISKDKINFAKFILELTFKYPKRTFESFTCTTYRFYYLNNEIQRGIGHYKPQSVYVIENMLPKDMNVKANENEINMMKKMDDVVYKNNIPILSTLMGSGIYINVLIIGIGYIIYKKKYRYILGYLPFFLLLLTQLAGPVVDQRYIYSAFTCFPILIATTIYLENSNITSEKKG